MVACLSDPEGPIHPQISNPTGAYGDNECISNDFSPITIGVAPRIHLSVCLYEVYAGMARPFRPPPHNIINK